MKRIDATGFAPGNLFTNGNPSLSIPATVVDDSWLNAVQEEIVNVILASGQILDQTNVNLTQLLTAINYLVVAGGTQYNQAITNNQAAPASITNMLFNSNNVKCAFIEYALHRQSDTGGSEKDEQGTLHCMYDEVGGGWRIANQSLFDDAGVTFTITGAGQVQYTSSNIAGSNSVGEITYSVRTILQP